MTKGTIMLDSTTTVIYTTFPLRMIFTSINGFSPSPIRTSTRTKTVHHPTSLITFNA
jgi:hypothetical protein